MKAGELAAMALVLTSGATVLGCMVYRTPWPAAAWLAACTITLIATHKRTRR